MGMCTEEMERKRMKCVEFTRIINCRSISYLPPDFVLKLLRQICQRLSFLNAFKPAALFNSVNHGVNYEFPYKLSQ